MLSKIVSGGQTGVDRAALDAAISTGLPHGGWCPRGGRAEDGTIPDHYRLVEASSVNYAVRTFLNVRDSDGTLILSRGELSGGTRLTLDFARRLGRPYLVVMLDGEDHTAEILNWIAEREIAVLNVAGPRESSAPGIHAEAKDLFTKVLVALKKRDEQAECKANGGQKPECT